MSKIVFNENNTEGHHPTAFEFRDTELRKEEKAVTTRLANCYDVLITNPVEGEVIKYNAAIQKWVNGEGGGSCENVLTENLILYVCVEPLSADTTY